MKRSEINKLGDQQIANWRERNHDPAVLPCVPVILINALTGDKPGIVVNLAPGLSADDTLRFLKAATEQVQKQVQVGN